MLISDKAKYLLNVVFRFFVRSVRFWDGLKLLIRTNYDFVDGTLNTVGYNDISLATEVVISCFI
jgi:hypothetical protein